MEKWLCLGSLGVAVVVLLLFVLDLVTGILLKGASPVVDILIIVCCALLGYLAFDAFRDQNK